MSNDAKVYFLAGDDDVVVVGPETINGTGEVHFDTDSHCFLSNEQARELGAALIEAADYAKAIQGEMEELPTGRPPKSVRDFEWTDARWRTSRSSPRP